jgi:hypothetical protein
VVEEKLAQALGELIKAGDIRVRLYKAFKRFLPLFTRDDLPEDLQAELVELKRDLSRLHPEYEDQGTAVVTIESMTEQEAQALATRIFELYLRLQKNRASGKLSSSETQTYDASPASSSRASSWAPSSFSFSCCCSSVPTPV